MCNSWLKSWSITSSCLVTRQAQNEAPPNMQCKDKFLILMAVVNHEVRKEDFTSDQMVIYIYLN